MSPPSAPHLSQAHAGDDASPAEVRGPRYERVARLGVGGMGRVWLARDRLLGREVALKELLEPTPALEARLRKEVALTASLDHPGIVPVYDLERGDDGRLSAVMRLVRGPTLRQWLTRQPSLEARVRRVAEAARAVAFAHARDVVHRDLKPENILVEEGGAAQVADWGLARRVSEGPAPREGTEGFLAPEATAGALPSRAADVYALGRVLEACLAAPAPPELRAVVSRACAQRPEARYPDAGALAAELEAWLDGREVQAYAYRPAERLARLLVAWRGPLLAGGAVLLIAFVALSFAWRAAVQQRDRAVAAEEAARVRERHLLEGQAVAEASRGALPEAALLAAGALARGPSASARGLLAALAAEPSPARRVRARSARCLEAGLFEEGHWCRQPTGTSLSWRGRAWHTPLRVQQARAAGPWLVLVDEAEQLWLETEAAPATTWLGPARRQGVRLELDAAAGLVLSADRGRVSVFDLRSGRALEQRAPCDEVPVLASWIESASGRLHHVCNDGRHLAGWPGGVLVPVQPSLPAAEAGALLAVASRGGEVLFGTTSGAVWRLGPGGLQPLLTVRAPVTRLELSADGALAVVVPAEENPVVLDVRRGLRRATLPRGVAAAVRFEGEQVVTWSEGVEQAWTLPGVGAPAVLRAERGLAAVAFAPAEGGPTAGALVAAGADGHLRRWSLADGAALDAPLGWQRTIKALAPAPSGALFVGGIDEEGVVELEPRGLRPARRWPAPTRIKHLGVDAAGAPWALGYDFGPVRWAPDRTLARSGAGRTWRDGVALDDGRALWLEASGELLLADAEGERVLLRVPGASHVGGHAALGVALVTQAELLLFDFEGRPLWRAGLPTRSTALRVTQRWVLVGTARGDVLAFDARGALVATHRAHEGTVSALAVTADGRWLASAGWDARVQRWDLAQLDAPPSVAELEARWGVSLETLLGAR